MFIGVKLKYKKNVFTRRILQYWFYIRYDFVTDGYPS